MIPSMSLMIRWGTYFWSRAPRYMPAKPPAPKRNPNAQSGEVGTPKNGHTCHRGAIPVRIEPAFRSRYSIYI